MKAIDEINAYVDRLDAAITELQRARQVALNAKSCLLRGVGFDAIPIPTFETSVVQAPIARAARVYMILMMAYETMKGDS